MLMATTYLQNGTKVSAPSGTGFSGLALQRKCACGGSAGVLGECEGCSNKEFPLQRSTLNSGIGRDNSSGVPPIVREELHSPGQPLDSQTRQFFEPRFGHDFSQVRVHVDQRAAEAAQAVDALA